MKTQLLTPKDTGRAARILRSGGLVGIPTETVYGLGANGLDPLAVRSIFLAKGRPQDNPLILHIPDPSWLELYCRDIPEAAWRLARRFWPGPLTMVLRRDPAVPDEVTAGLDTVGMRCPAHELCRAVIEAAGVPVAAPSGNTSGRPSPTSVADMLEDMNGKINAILDGGSCQVGVESTIIDMTAATPRLLRPGGVPLEELRAVLGEVELDPAILRPMEEGEKPLAPGMKYRHYAPKAPVIVVKGSPARSAAYILEHLSPTYWDGVICFDEFADWYPSHPVERLGGALDHWENARRLFHALRAMDEAGVKRIWAQSPDTAGMGLAVVNRLDKAAGFHIVEV